MTDTDVLKALRTAGDNRLGEFGETVWANIFRASGVNYIPLSKLDVGGAPRIQGNGKVLPDFDIAGDDWTAYVDSKCKSQCVLFRQKNQLRHGIDRRNFEAYRAAGLTFRKECALAILELWDHEARWSGEIMIETLRELGEPYQGISDQRHMVYWPKKAFRNLHAFTPGELWAVYKGRTVETFGEELRLVFCRQKQTALFE